MGSSLGKEIHLGDTSLRIKELIFEEGLWSVYLAQDTNDSNISYDLYIATCQIDDTDSLKIMQDYINAWKILPIHPNIAKYIDSDIIEDNSLKRGFILTEHYDGGSLNNYIQNLYPQRLNEKAILAIIRDVACSIAVLHSLNPSISHKAISPNYIYFDNSGAFYKCKLVPSLLLGKKNTTPTSISDISNLEKTIDKTVNSSYLPPELYNLYKMRSITEKVDIWELGVLMYFLAFYTTPFENDNGTINSTYLEDGRFTFINEYMNNFSNEFLNMIKFMLIPDMKKRPSIFDVLQYLNTIPRFKPTKEYLTLVNQSTKTTITSVKAKIESKQTTTRKSVKVVKKDTKTKDKETTPRSPSLPDRNIPKEKISSQRSPQTSRKSVPSTIKDKDSSKPTTSPQTSRKSVPTTTKDKDNSKPTTSPHTPQSSTPSTGKGSVHAKPSQIKNTTIKQGPSTRQNTIDSEVNVRTMLDNKENLKKVVDSRIDSNDNDDDDDHIQLHMDDAKTESQNDEYSYSSDDSDNDNYSTKREKGETVDRIKAQMLHYFGGKHNYERWVFKCTSKVPEPPHINYLRKIILEAWESKSINFFYKELVKRPLFSSEIVAVKALTAMLRIHQLGSQDILDGSMDNINIFEEMAKRWGIIEDDASLSDTYNWAPFISRFATIIVTKIRFHSLYRQFDFRYQNVTNEEIDDEELVAIASRMTTFMISLDLAERWALANSDPVIVGTIRPLIDESYAIYESVTSIIKTLLKTSIGEEIIVNDVRNRYEEARQSFSVICLRAKQNPELNLFDVIPTISEVSPLQVSPPPHYESRMSLMETLETMKSAGDMDDDDDEDEVDVNLLGLLYKETSTGKIKPLVGANWLIEKGEQLLPSLKRIITIKGNNRCCECNCSIDCSRASVNLGVFLCNRCSTLHTKLPNGISTIKRLKTEDLLPIWIAVLADIGNKKANKFWEFNMKSTDKPQEKDDDKKWLDFLQKKYVSKLWINSNTKKIEEDQKVQPESHTAYQEREIQNEIRETNASVDLVDLFGDTNQTVPEEKLSDVFEHLDLQMAPQCSQYNYQNSMNHIVQLNKQFPTNRVSQPLPSLTSPQLAPINPATNPIMGPMSPPMNSQMAPMVPQMQAAMPSSYFMAPQPNYQYSMNQPIYNPLYSNMAPLSGALPYVQPTYPSSYIMPIVPIPSQNQALSPMTQQNVNLPSLPTQPIINNNIQPLAPPMMSPQSMNSSISMRNRMMYQQYSNSNSNTATNTDYDNTTVLLKSTKPETIPSSTETSTAASSVNNTSSNTTANYVPPSLNTYNKPLISETTSMASTFEAFSQGDESDSVNRPLETPGKNVTGTISSSTKQSIKSSESDEDEDDDYETRIEKQERKQDEVVKKKVMSALQNALSDIQLTGIQIDFEEIEILDRIGVGGFAIVYKGYYRGTEVAVKKLRVSRMSAKAIRDFHSEVFIMKTLRHPNIVIFMGLVMDPVCLVTEFCQNGNLFDLLHDTDVYSSEDEDSSSEEEHYHYDLPWSRRVRIACDVARGMNFLHTSSPVIIHRDLKTLNILVDEKWTAKVSDFGLSRFKSIAGSLMTGQCGTYQWMAPEVIGGHVYTEKADVFSFGVILWEMFTRKVPYEGMQPMQVAVMVHTNKKRLAIPNNCPEWYADLIRECWDADPEVRPNFAEILRRLRKGGPAPTSYV